MGAIPEYLRHISVQTVVVRFIVAALCSGIIGISRGKNTTPQDSGLICLYVLERHR